VVKSVVHEKFRALVVTRGDAYVVLLIGHVVVGETPIDEAEVTHFVIDNDVERFDIAVDDAVGVSVVESFKDFVGIQSDVHVLERADQHFSFHVRDVLENKARGFANGVAHQVKQFDDIGATVKSLQDFCFAVDFLCAHWLKDLNDACLVVLRIDALIDF